MSAVGADPEKPRHVVLSTEIVGFRHSISREIRTMAASQAAANALTNLARAAVGLEEFGGDAAPILYGYSAAGDVAGLVQQHAATGGLQDERHLARIARGVAEGLNYLHRCMHQVCTALGAC